MGTDPNAVDTVVCAQPITGNGFRSENHQQTGGGSRSVPSGGNNHPFGSGLPLYQPQIYQHPV